MATRLQAELDLGTAEAVREDYLADLQRTASELCDACEDEWVLEQVVRLLRGE